MTRMNAILIMRPTHMSRGCGWTSVQVLAEGVDNFLPGYVDPMATNTKGEQLC